MLLGLYNPYPTVLPAPGGDKTTAALNEALASVAAAVPGTSFSNPEPEFNPSILTAGPETADLPTTYTFTAMCPGGVFNPASPEADIHPTKDRLRRDGGRGWSRFLQPLRLWFG